MSWLSRAVPAVVVLLGVHALLKFLFFLLPYGQRRAALDKSYGNAPTATRTSDAVLLGITIVVAALVLARGVDPVAFLGGLWIGATLIQVYFHRFHVMPPPEVSPIKMMSYAIQDSPWRPWREMMVLAVLIVVSIVSIATAQIR